MRVRWRIAGYVVIGLLWVAVPWIAAELYATISVWRTAHYNRYVLSLQNTGGALAMPETPAPAQRSAPADPITARTWAESGLAVRTGPGEWARPCHDEDEAAIERRRRAFPGLSDSDRDYCARLHNDLVAVFDASGNTLHRYGDWMREGYENVDTFFAKARKSQDTHYSDYHFATAGLDLPMRFYFLANPADKCLYGFVDIEWLIVMNGVKNLPESSPWEIPFFRYKKDLRNAHTGLGTYNISTNNFGYLGDDIVVPKPAGVFRIVCIGGSTTEEGAQDATYPKLLEKRLRAAFPGRAIEVINCGISGVTTPRHLFKLDEYLSFQPDLLLVYEGGNDICQNLLVYWRWIRNPLQKWLTVSPFVENELNRLLFPSDVAIMHDLNALTVRNIDIIRDAAAASGVRTVICGLACPDWNTSTADERAFLDFQLRRMCAGRGYLSAGVYCHIVDLYRQALKGLCRRENLLYIPTEDVLTGGLHYFIDVCHLRPEGIERKAVAIAEALKTYIAPAVEALPPVSATPDAGASEGAK